MSHPPDAASHAALIRETAFAPATAAALATALRLLARATATPAALLAVTTDTGLRCAAQCGLDESERPAALAQCAAALAGTAAGTPPATAHLLHTDDGAPIGVLCLPHHPTPLAPADRTALEDAARLILSALEQQAAALRAERRVAALELHRQVLAAAGAAADTTAALAAMIATIRAATGAAICHCWRLTEVDQALHLVAGDSRGTPADLAFLAECRTLRLPIADTLLGEAIRTGRQIVTPEIAAELPAETGDPAHPMRRLSARHGLASRILTPLSVGEDRYALLLCFDQPARERELTAIAALVRDATLPLLPVLQRQREYERAELFRRIVEATSDAVLVTEAEPIDEPGPRIVYANPAFERMTGYTAAEVIGRSPRLLQGAATEPAARAALRAAIAAGTPVRQEVTNYRKDGTPFIVDLNLARLDGGWQTYLVAIQRDMDAHYRTASDTARREEAFRRLFDSNPVPMWIYDRTTLRFLEVNAAATEVYGWSRDEFLAMTILDIRPEEDRDSLAEAVAAARPGRVVSSPWRHCTRAGEERLVQVMYSPLRFNGVAAMLAGAFDITERIRAEQALRHNQAVLQRTASNLAEAMHLARLGTWRRKITSDDVEWSDEIYAMFGVDPASFTPTRTSFLELVHPDDRAMVIDTFGRAAAGDNPGRFEFRVVRPDGAICHCWTEARLQRDPEDGQLWLDGLFQDITERRHTEQMLLRSEKLVTIGQMTGGIAHDFNNLLTVILLSLEAAEELAGDNPALLALLRAASDAGEKGAQLTGQLLSYARRQKLRPIAILPDSFATDLRDLLPRVLGEQHSLRVTVAPHTPPFRADPAQLEAAMLNLCLNARHAMPQGGAIALDLAPVIVTEADANGQDDLRPGRYVRISVADRGTGMSAETLARVFEPFFTTKPPGEGTGLGLSMVLGFAQQSGGHVSIDSEPGRGTEVKLFLPQADAPADAPADARPGIAPPLPTSPTSLPPIEVLLVEDKENVRAIATRLCSTLGLKPTAAATAEEALTYLRAGFRFGLLFTDVVLGGGIDGTQLAEQARALQPGLPVLLTSGYTERAIGPNGHLEPGTHLLSKPYSRAQLIQAVTAALAATAD